MKKNIHRQLSRRFGLWLLVLAALLSATTLSAEGSNNLTPSADDAPVMLETGREGFGLFADFLSDDKGRLIVSIDDPGEIVYFGLAPEYNDSGQPFRGDLFSSYFFRIRRINADSSTTIVHGPFRINNQFANVNSQAEAVFGQYEVTRTQDGKPIFVFRPEQKGDYIIEFQDAERDNFPRVNIPFWDITVTEADGQTVKPGRLWSRNWAFRTPPMEPLSQPECVWNRPFNGDLYSYTDDGFVSRIDFNEAGMQGLSFTVAFNRTGPGNSGDLAEDRKSIPNRNATQNTAEHRIFLDLPDEALFPSGECGTVSNGSNFNCDGNGGYCLDVTVTRPGQVEILLDFDGNGDLDENDRDVLLTYEFTDTLNLSECISWDGLRGDSTPVSFSDTVDIYITYAQGVQHWSAYDVEYMKKGFCVETIRPECAQQLSSNILYWDDRDILEDPGTGAKKDQREGCACESDCRSWDFFQTNSGGACQNFEDSLTTGYGDKNTLNTYWFANSRVRSTARVPIVSASISGPTNLCPGDTVTLFAQDNGLIGTPTYLWSGPNVDGVTIDSVIVYEAGEYCVTISDNQGCSSQTCRTIDVLDISDSQFPEEFVVCLGEERKLPVAGNPNFTYQWTPTVGIDNPNSNQPTFSPSVTTTYTVTIRNESVEGQSCETTESVLVIVVPEIDLQISGSSPICAETTTITASVATPSTIVLYTGAGDSIDTGTSFTLPLSGYNEYYIVATSLQGECMDSISFKTSGGPVNVTFPNDVVGCISEGVNLMVTNLDPNDTLTYSYEPSNLFDPATIDSPNPTFIGGAGDYDVTVTVTNQFGCSASDVVNVVAIDDLGLLSFEPELDCDGRTVSFTNTGANGFGLVYDFGDGNTSNNQNPTYTYDMAGTYTVTLSLIFDQECVADFTRQVTTYDSVLDADFTASLGDCEDGTASISFMDATVNVLGDALDYAWTFTGADQNSSTDANPTITVSNPSTVTASLTVTSDRNCISTLDTSFTVSIPTLDLTDVTICPGDSTALNPNPVSGQQYTWSPAPDFDANDPNPVTSLAGTYSVTVTGSGTDFSCSTTGTITVTVADSIGLVVNGPDGNPIGNGDGGDAGAGNGGNGNGGGDGDIVLPTIITCGETVPLSVALSTNVSVGVVYTRIDGTPLGSGNSIDLTVPNGRDTIVVTATSALGCVERDTLVIVNRQVDAMIDVGSEGLNVCAATDTMLTVINNQAGDTLTYAWEDNDIINGDLDGASVDITTPNTGRVELMVLVTNQFGCDTTITVPVNVVPFTPNDFPDVIQPCFGEEITIAGGMAIDGYTYTYSPSGILGTSDPANPTGSFTEDTQLTVTITDDVTGCTDVQTIDVQVQPEIALEVTPADTVLCEPGSVSVSGSSINPNAVIIYYSDPELTNEVGRGPTYDLNAPQVNGTYTVYVTATDGNTECTQVESVTVTVSSITDALPLTEINACPGESTDIFGEDGPRDNLTYTYDPAGVIDLSDPANPRFVGDASTLVTVTVTDPATGCSVESMLMANVQPDLNLEVTPGDTTLCEPGMVTIGSSATGDNVILTYYDDPGLTNQIGQGATYTLNASAADGRYVVYVQALNPDFDCPQVDSITVTVSPVVGEMPLMELSVCPGQTANLFANGSAPTDGLNYTYEPAGVVDVSDPVNPVFIGDASTLVTVTIADPTTGCSVNSTVDVTVQPEIVLNITPSDTVLCEPGSVTIGAGTDDDDVVITYFDDAGLTNQIGQGGSYTLNATAADSSYVIYVQAVDPEFNCPQIDSITVTVSPVVGEMPLMELSVCPGQTANLFADGTTPTTGLNYTYEPAGVVDVSDPANPVFIGDASTLVTVTIADPNTGCSVSSTVDVTVQPEIPLTVTPADTVLCEPGSVMIGAGTDNESVVITYFDDAGLTNQIGEGGSYTLVADVADTSYTIFILAVDPDFNCPKVDSVTITVTPFLPDVPVTELEACPGQGVSIFGDGGPTDGLTYTYDPSGVIDLTDPADPQFVGDVSTTVTVTITDPVTGCSTTSTISANVADLSGLTGTADPTTIILGESSTLTVTGCQGDCTYEWFPPSGTVSPTTGPEVLATPEETGVLVYEVEVMQGDCPTTVEIELRVEDPLCEPDQVFVPNIFTPNGDNSNDVLRVRSRFAEELTEFEWIIYNRWGQEVYNSTDIFESWDGTINGDSMEPDVYGYWLRVVCPGGQELIQQGNVTLMR